MLSGKHILFIAPNFFGYEEEIALELRSRGADVDFISATPFKSTFLKAALRLKRKWVVPFLEKFFYKKILSVGKKKYDYIFVLKGEALSENFLINLKKKYSTATFILYLWDSLENTLSLEKNIKVFDRCYSFDRVDAKKYDLNYRPLFFGKGFKREPMQQFKIGLSFVGTAHSDRYLVVSRTLSMLPADLVSYSYFFLQSRWVFYIRRLLTSAFSGAKVQDFNFLPMSKSDVQDVFKNSFSIFDIEHPLQRGLTIRSIEALGAGKKLITTNKSIVDEDFYNSQNILILDREGLLEIPVSFFDSPFQSVPEDICYKYSIRGWIDEIFQVK
tara:strand:- start:4676 stop:5662 length:987 start_codon:yes stop_codon:yes gene_type:complete